jgi:pseudouridine synthase
VRLQKFLAQAGVASRRRAEELILAGQVRVNGEVVTQLGQRVDERRDRVEVDGRRVRPEEPLYRVILKPRQCLATLAPPSAQRPTMARFLADLEPGWKVVAPLDFPAEGVVLLTTDGALAERMSRGGGRVPMTYHLKLQGHVGAPELERLRRGWKWLGRTVRPVSVEPLATTGKNVWVEMVIPETRARVLKAAGDAIRRPLLKISRVRLGTVSFEGLRMGGWRDLTRGEVNALRRAAGAAE